MTLTLIRLLSKDGKKEWLLVKDGDDDDDDDDREVLRVPWDDDLLMSIDAQDIGNM